jgi:hypothetical protein
MNLIIESNIKDELAYLTVHIRLSTCNRSKYGTSSSAMFDMRSTYTAVGKVALAAGHHVCC